MRYNLHLIYKREHEFLLSGAHFFVMLNCFKYKMHCTTIFSRIIPPSLSSQTDVNDSFHRMTPWIVWVHLTFDVICCAYCASCQIATIWKCGGKEECWCTTAAALKRSSGTLVLPISLFAKKVSLTLSVIWSPSLQTAKKMRSKFRQMSTRKPREMESRWQVFGIQNLLKGVKIRGISFEY